MAVTIINGPRRRRQTRQRVARTHTGTHTHRDWHTHAHLLPRGMRAAAKQPLQIIPSYCTLLHLLRRIAVCRRPCSCIYSFGPRRRSAGPASDALSRRVTVLSRWVTVLSRRVTTGSTGSSRRRGGAPPPAPPPSPPTPPAPPQQQAQQGTIRRNKRNMAQQGAIRRNKAQQGAIRRNKAPPQICARAPRARGEPGSARQRVRYDSDRTTRIGRLG